GPLGTRDRALLLVGFAGALRRSELVSLDVTDLEHRDEGLVVMIRRSKTDQEGAGRPVGLPYGSNPATCPVRAVTAWTDLAAISDGPLLRPVDRHGRIATARLSPAGANRAVQRAVQRTGTDPRPYSAHSLRAGLAPAAAEAGVSERAIMNRPASAPLPSPAATSAAAPSSGTTPPPTSGCNRLLHPPRCTCD